MGFNRNSVEAASENQFIEANLISFQYNIIDLFFRWAYWRPILFQWMTHKIERDALENFTSIDFDFQFWGCLGGEEMWMNQAGELIWLLWEQSIALEQIGCSSDGFSIRFSIKTLSSSWTNPWKVSSLNPRSLEGFKPLNSTRRMSTLHATYVSHLFVYNLSRTSRSFR